MRRVQRTRSIAARRRLWLRSERQTLRRLPECGDVLFTIRIRQCTLARLCEVSGAAARLLAQIDAMPDTLKAYKRILDIEDARREWLTQRAGAKAIRSDQDGSATAEPSWQPVTTIRPRDGDAP